MDGLAEKSIENLIKFQGVQKEEKKMTLLSGSIVLYAVTNYCCCCCRSVLKASQRVDK